MHFDLTDLRLLVGIVETGSITAGAEQVCLSLSSASTRIGGLEKQAGIVLLVRGRRGATPTAVSLHFPNDYLAFSLRICCSMFLQQRR